MNTAIISLGSNSSNHDRILHEALEHLNVSIIEFTGPYSHPTDNNPLTPYSNIVALIETDENYENLHSRFKNIETLFGRNQHSSNSDNIALDIDIVVFNGTIIKQADYDRQYFSYGLSRLSSVRPLN